MRQLSRCDHAVGPARLREDLPKPGQKLVDRLADGRITEARSRERTQDGDDGKGLLASHNVLKKRYLKLHSLPDLLAQIIFKERRKRGLEPAQDRLVGSDDSERRFEILIRHGK